MQEWRFFVKSEQSYAVFSVFQQVRGGKKKKKRRENVFQNAHRNNLIQSVEDNLTIILVQEWRFFVKSQQSCQFFSFSTNLTSTNEVSE